MTPGAPASPSYTSLAWLGAGSDPLVVPVLSRISTKTLPVYLKDSITTWEVLAVSLSQTKGM